MFQQPDIPIQKITRALTRKVYSELMKSGIRATAIQAGIKKSQNVFAVLIWCIEKFTVPGKSGHKAFAYDPGRPKDQHEEQNKERSCN